MTYRVIIAAVVVVVLMFVLYQTKSEGAVADSARSLWGDAKTDWNQWYTPTTASAAPPSGTQTSASTGSAATA